MIDPKFVVFSGVGLLTESKSTSELGLATTSYVDTAVTKVWKDQGDYNVSGGTAWPTSANTIGAVPIKAGFLWVVAGAATNGTTLTGGKVVSNGDTIRALVDAATNAGADWGVNEANLGYTPENQANKVNDLTDSTSTAKYTSVKAVVDGLSGKQNTLPDVITANTYGSSTQYPVITFNAKGIATGVTLQTVPLPTFTDATFSVQKNGSPSITASWDLTALTTSWVHTYPNKAIDFNTLSSIGASDGNALSGTRTRIIGGSSNTVSGTDVVVIDCSNNTITGTGVTFISIYNMGNIDFPVFPAGTTVLGSSLHPQIVLFTSVSRYCGALATTVGLCTSSLSANGTTYDITTDTGAPSKTNTPLLVSGHEVGVTRYAGLGSAVHDVDFIVTFGDGSPIVPSRTFFAKRRVYAACHIVSGTPTWATSTEVVGTDTNFGTCF
jgi:hypothetical protein